MSDIEIKNELLKIREELQEIKALINSKLIITTCQGTKEPLYFGNIYKVTCNSK